MLFGSGGVASKTGFGGLVALIRKLRATWEPAGRRISGLVGRPHVHGVEPVGRESKLVTTRVAGRRAGRLGGVEDLAVGVERGAVPPLAARLLLDRDQPGGDAGGVAGAAADPSTIGAAVVPGGGAVNAVVGRERDRDRRGRGIHRPGVGRRVALGGAGNGLHLERVRRRSQTRVCLAGGPRRAAVGECGAVQRALKLGDRR